MFKRLFIGLFLIPTISIAEVSSGLDKNQNGDVFIRDAVFNCEYFAFHKNDSLEKMQSEKKKGNAELYVENLSDKSMFAIATLSDVLSISTPELFFFERKNNGVAYNYTLKDEIFYHLVSTPKTGIIMVIDGRIGDIKANVIIRNCKVRYTVTPHGGDDDL